MTTLEQSKPAAEARDSVLRSGAVSSCNDWLGRVLVACEFSGLVRDAFAALGWDAWSCDLLPSERPGNHIQGNVWGDGILQQDWDILIFHLECTRLCNSGVRWLVKNGVRQIHTDRWKRMVSDAIAFRGMLDLPIPHIAGENPIMHGHARKIVGIAPTQIIQPWQFGHGETKATCLWLKNLPPLKPTNIVEGREQRIWKLPPSADRWKERSRTFSGVAEAMASQWTLATRPNEELTDHHPE
jgi:hypothetical protein